MQSQMMTMPSNLDWSNTHIKKTVRTYYISELFLLTEAVASGNKTRLCCTHVDTHTGHVVLHPFTNHTPKHAFSHTTYSLADMHRKPQTYQGQNLTHIIVTSITITLLGNHMKTTTV